jgi:hypothetical protein
LKRAHAQTSSVRLNSTNHLDGISWKVFWKNLQWEGADNLARKSKVETPAELFQRVFGEEFDGKYFAEKAYSLIEWEICKDDDRYVNLNLTAFHVSWGPRAVL